MSAPNVHTRAGRQLRFRTLLVGLTLTLVAVGFYWGAVASAKFSVSGATRAPEGYVGSLYVGEALQYSGWVPSRVNRVELLLQRRSGIEAVEATLISQRPGNAGGLTAEQPPYTTPVSWPVRAQGKGYLPALWFKVDAPSGPSVAFRVDYTTVGIPRTAYVPVHYWFGQD